MGDLCGRTCALVSSLALRPGDVVFGCIAVYDAIDEGALVVGAPTPEFPALLTRFGLWAPLHDKWQFTVVYVHRCNEPMAGVRSDHEQCMGS